MPHLDITTYITQYSWTLITLLTLYIIMSLYILPKIQNTLRIRRILKEEAAAPNKETGINKTYILIRDILNK